MNIDQIIGKLMGEGSVGEEKSALEAWKKEAEDNIKALVDMQKIDTLSKSLKGYEDFNVDDSWNSFESKLNDNDHADTVVLKKETSFFSLTNISRIAAVLVIVVGSLFVLNHFSTLTSDSNLLLSYSATNDRLDFDLTDGTQVTLDKHSDLKLVENRSVVLNGRAHFDVSRDESHQFKIELPVGNIIVLGTEFTVDANEITTEIYVEEGSVQYELANRTWVLVQGDLVKVVNNEPVILKRRDDNYDSWINQRLMFRDNNMVEVVSALSRHFKKDIIIEDKKAFADCNVVNVFTNATLNDILNDLSKSHGLEYEIKGDKVFIVSANC